MVTRFRYILLLSLIFVTVSSRAIGKEEEGYTQYVVLLENGYAEDYQTISGSFSEGDAPSMDALHKLPYYTFERQDEVLKIFYSIRKILSHNHGEEELVMLSASSSTSKRVGVLLTFKNLMPISAFSESLFSHHEEQSRLPKLIVDKRMITKYKQQAHPNPGTPPSQNQHFYIPWIPTPQ
jgi:hypothetical protein